MRASKRAEVESVDAGEIPTVGDSTGDQAEEKEANELPRQFPALAEAGEIPVAPTVGETPIDPMRDVEAPGGSPGVSTTVGVRGSVGESLAPPTVVVQPSEGASPTEIDTPSVNIGQLPAGLTLPNSARGVLPSYIIRVKPPVVHKPAVGVTPPIKGQWWVDAAGMRYEARRVQRVIIAQHSMALGEERVYETLWHARESDGVFAEGRRSKTFSLGYDRIARLVRLNEKSVRILLPKLIAKRILEVVAAEDSAGRIGRTYRIFSYEEILERQRAANLTAVVKNGRAVEFVWLVGEISPAESSPGVTPTVGVMPTGSLASCQAPAGDSPSVGGSSSGYPSDLASRVRAIVPAFDEEALRALWTNCAKVAPDCTADEVEYCLQLKARQLLLRGKGVNNPVGLMLWAVPKCFEGQAALHLVYRRQKQAEEERFRAQLEEYRRLAADPATSPEDRAWYQRMVADLG